MNKKDLIILKGTFLHTPSAASFTCHKEHYLVARQGRIVSLTPELPEKYAGAPITDYSGNLLIPGFVDLHTHAAQFRQRGLGLDLPLLPWLETYTFPEEQRFSATAYAKEIYDAFAAELLHQGTTRVVTWATIHEESARLLCHALEKYGLSAYVGKVSMDCNCPEYLREETAQALKSAEAFLSAYAKGSLVRGIVTPRFAPTCSRELLQGLGQLAARYQLPVQSHLSENKEEIAWVNQLFPERAGYHDVYDYYGLFGQQPTLMAHCVHLSEAALERMREKQVFAVHCPDSNLNLGSGIMPARRLLNANVPVGLGSDVGAGHTFSMPQAIVRAVQLSKLSFLQDASQNPLTLSESFYLATKGGGRFFGQVGSFEEGYELDALALQPAKHLQTASPVEQLQHFLYTQNASAITTRYIAGKRRS